MLALVKKRAGPPDPSTSPWLHLAAPLGKFAAWFLITQNFLFLFAPLFFLLDLPTYTDPSGPGGSLLYVFTDPAHLLSIADFAAMIGIVILCSAMLLIFIGLIRGDRVLGIDVFAPGIVVFGCLAAWIPVMAYSLGRARGTVSSVDAVAATGGWSVASLLLLAASLAYLFFALRLENGTKAQRLSSFNWPIYGAVNVLGSAVIAASFQNAAGGAGSMDAFAVGLVLKVTLVPMLGVWAYRDLRDRFPNWKRVKLHDVPGIGDTVIRPESVDTVIRPENVDTAMKTIPRGILVSPRPPPPDD